MTKIQQAQSYTRNTDFYLPKPQQGSYRTVFFRFFSLLALPCLLLLDSPFFTSLSRLISPALESIYHRHLMSISRSLPHSRPVRRAKFVSFHSYVVLLYAFELLLRLLHPSPPPNRAPYISNRNFVSNVRLKTPRDPRTHGSLLFKALPCCCFYPNPVA